LTAGKISGRITKKTHTPQCLVSELLLRTRFLCFHVRPEGALVFYMRISSSSSAVSLPSHTARVPVVPAAGDELLRNHGIVNTRFESLRKVGEGGMGTVYKVFDRVESRIVALKVLKTEAQGGREEAELAVRRFKREFRSAQRFRHPHIAAVYELFPGTPTYFTMEYVEGVPIHRFFGVETPVEGTGAGKALNSRSRLDRLSTVLRQILSALAHIHRHAIVHRDLKPDNILVAPEGTGLPGPGGRLPLASEPWLSFPRPQVKLLDFGLAKEKTLSERLTKTGVILGSVDFLSPEQAVGARLDERSDLYSLGVILYQILSGRLPFWDEDVLKTLLKHVHEEAPPIRSFNPGVDPRFEHLTLKLLRKDPDERVPGAEECARFLDEMKGRNARPRQASIALQAALLPGRGFAASADTAVHPSSPFVGRSAELSILKKQLRALKAEGRGGFVLISGETGIGKSRLAAEAERRARLEGLHVFSAGGIVGGTPPYGIFLTVLDQMLATRIPSLRGGESPAPAEILSRLAALRSEVRERRKCVRGKDASRTRAERSPLTRDFVDSIRAYASRFPTLLLVEDLQWVDEASLEILAGLCRGPHEPKAGSSPLIFGLLREEGESRDHPVLRRLAGLVRRGGVHELRLEGLGWAEVSEMARNILSCESGSLRAERHLFQVSRGNPYLVEQVIRSLVENHALFMLDGEAFDILPASKKRDGKAGERSEWCEEFGEQDDGSPVFSVLRECLTQIPETARRVLIHAAILGAAFRFDSLRALVFLPEDRLIEILEALVARKILMPPAGDRDTYCFRHEAFRTVLTRGLPERWKRSVHLKIARLRESEGRETPRVPALDLLRHYQAARAVSKVLQYLPAAGDELAAGDSYRAALDCYNSFLELWAHLDRKTREPYEKTTARVVREAARILKRIGSYEKSSTPQVRETH
jgi:serine/threonine protein kinase